MLFRETLSACPSCKHTDCTATSPACAIVLYHLASGCCDPLHVGYDPHPASISAQNKFPPDGISQRCYRYIWARRHPRQLSFIYGNANELVLFPPDSSIIISPALTHTVLQREVCPWETRYFPNTHNCISGAKAGNSNLMSESLGSQKVILRTGQSWTEWNQHLEQSLPAPLLLKTVLNKQCWCSALWQTGSNALKGKVAFQVIYCTLEVYTLQMVLHPPASSIWICNIYSIKNLVYVS